MAIIASECEQSLCRAQVNVNKRAYCFYFRIQKNIKKDAKIMRTTEILHSKNINSSGKRKKNKYSHLFYVNVWFLTIFGC